MDIVLSHPPKNKFCESSFQFAFQFDVFAQSKLEVNNYRHFFLVRLCSFNTSNESIFFTFPLPFFCN